MDKETNAYLEVSRAIDICLRGIANCGDLPPVDQLHAAICDAFEKFHEHMTELQTIRHKASVQNRTVS